MTPFDWSGPAPISPDIGGHAVLSPGTARSAGNRLSGVRANAIFF